MRVMMMWCGLLLTVGCAKMGSLGPDTTHYRKWWRDCGVEKPLPPNIAQFKGSMPSPNSALVEPGQEPPQTSNVKGKLRVFVPMSECNGLGVRVVELTPSNDVTPAAVPTSKKYDAVEIEPSRWNE